MTPFERHLQAAAGFLDLGLPLDADEELDQIEPEMRSLSEVLAVRAKIYQELRRWEPMEAVCQQLCRIRPEEPQWVLALATATRYRHGVQEALEVLAPMVGRFPQEPIIHYNLACYAAQLGHLNAARARLAEAIKLDPECRKLALNDSDLAALHPELK